VQYALRQIVSILLLPFTVAVIVPFWLLGGDAPHGSDLEPNAIRVLAIAAGTAAFLLGLTLFVSTVLHFARVGRGTLAPWDPPRVLVVEGVYRHVRNPMISGVLFLLLSEVLLTGSRRLLAWFGLFLVVNLIYIPLLEEPVLAHRFGERYRLYRENVPRWIPRRSAWVPPWQGTAAGNHEGHPRSAPD
jgi:protein-S-isoprenylcysteine O-methyltransferase Ste14